MSLNEEFQKGRVSWDDMIPTNMAKKEYFLTSTDLKALQNNGRCVHVGGGIGCGAPQRNYLHIDLEAAAVRAHGKEGYKRKREQRDSREAKKRAREDKASEAYRAMMTPQPKECRAATPDKENTQGNIPVIDLTSSPAAPKTPDPAVVDVSKLRKCLLRGVKKGMGFMSSGCPKNIKLEVPGVSSASFAALIGRAGDPGLATLVRGHGGVFKHGMQGREVSTLFGVGWEKLGRTFHHEGVSQRICEDHGGVTLKYRSMDQTLVVLAYAEITMETFE
mmetsp:Transcript_20276/g.64520  ORF Transcript_20276/g.64520 Transcript_20276/m.64520 type:complete len:276 (-) Transcript_20276:65-892(-)